MANGQGGNSISSTRNMEVCVDDPDKNCGDLLKVAVSQGYTPAKRLRLTE